jgi:hypothetical protein
VRERWDYLEEISFEMSDMEHPHCISGLKWRESISPE